MCIGQVETTRKKTSAITLSEQKQMSLPNILTLVRIALIPLIIALILIENSTVRWLAFALFVFAAVTDYLDGYLARRMNLISPLGRMLDPIADKLLVAALLIAFSFDGSFDLWLVWAAILIMMREIAVAGLREFLGEKQVVVHVSTLAKFKTTAQLIALGVVMLMPVVSNIYLAARGMMWLAALLTLYTGYEYFKGAWPHLKEKEETGSGERDKEPKK